MKHINDIKTLRAVLSTERQKEMAFVPTMGNLHEGHLELIRQAKKLAKIVVVSLFVNPLQFGPHEDFDKYPRTQLEDLQKLKQLNVDIVFTPHESEIYSDLSTTSKVCVPQISDELCGKFRPHFFYGVTTIVSKLFNIVQPNIAIFGEKDFQQFYIIKKMVNDLSFPISIIAVPTVREKDGLAMSSRNQYLSLQEREKATHIYKLLCRLQNSILENQNSYDELQLSATQELQQQGFKVDYVEVRNKTTLALPTKDDDELIILVAAWVGTTRLIDNMSVKRN